MLLPSGQIWRQKFLLKHRYISDILHSFATKNTVLFILTDMTVSIGIISLLIDHQIRTVAKSGCVVNVVHSTPCVREVRETTIHLRDSVSKLSLSLFPLSTSETSLYSLTHHALTCIPSFQVHRRVKWNFGKLCNRNCSDRLTLHFAVLAFLTAL
jgi:hypothetical protein